MNTDQIGGLIRAIGGVAVGWAVGKGYITSEDGQWLLAGAGTAVIGAWSWWTNKPKAA